jgi:tetratricopeptide (TPR) repeat protein
MLFRRRQKPFDRAETLAAADRARARGRKRKAISKYREILANDPGDAVVHGKIAPLLAESKQVDEALKSFERAAQGHLTKGFADRALSVYTQASSYFPLEPAFWEQIATLHLQKARRADALKALLLGGRRMVKGDKKLDAVRLLRRALEIEPLHVETTIVLARVLARTGKRDDAVRVLEALASHIHGKARRRIRGAVFRIHPTFGNAFRWLRGK